MYVFDFDEDKNVLAMNLAEVGLYVLALNESWKRGSIPDDAVALAGMIRRKPAEVKRAWSAVRPCWIENGKPGELINPRQEREREEAEKRVDQAQHAANSRHNRAGVRASAQVGFEHVLRGSESGSVSGLEAEKTTKTSTGAREDLVDFQTFMHRWNHHRRLKKPPKHLRERAEARWQSIEITEEQLAAALDGYCESEWAKTQNYPILGFVKDPHSWAVRAALEVEGAEEAVVIRLPTTDAPQSAESPLPYWAEEWNRLVVSGAVVQIWRPSAKTALAYNKASGDDVFGNSAGLIFAKCQDLLTRAPDKAAFITFAYALENWPKILNGECNWVLMDNAKAGSKSGPQKSLVQILQEGRKKEAEQRKHVHPGV